LLNTSGRRRDKSRTDLRCPKCSRCQSGPSVEDGPAWITIEMPLLPQPNCQRSNRNMRPTGAIVPGCQIDRGHVPDPIHPKNRVWNASPVHLAVPRAPSLPNIPVRLRLVKGQKNFFAEPFGRDTLALLRATGYASRIPELYRFGLPLQATETRNCRKATRHPSRRLDPNDLDSP